MKVLNLNILIPTKVLILLATFSLIGCQHARVRFKMIEPEQCTKEVYSNSDCLFAKASLDAKVREGGTLTHVLNQDYFFWGFYPRNININLTDTCPAGIYEIHRYATFKDTLFEQLTIGIYSPRSIKLVCY